MCRCYVDCDCWVMFSSVWVMVEVWSQFLLIFWWIFCQILCCEVGVKFCQLCLVILFLVQKWLCSLLRLSFLVVVLKVLLCLLVVLQCVISVFQSLIVRLRCLVLICIGLWLGMMIWGFRLCSCFKVVSQDFGQLWLLKGSLLSRLLVVSICCLGSQMIVLLCV